MANEPPNQPATSEPVQDEGKAYMFKRDYKSSMRLNYNHHIMKGTAGYLLHPSIPTDETDLRIADVGAGTGIWSLELASTLPPTVHFDCFDESDDQFPHKAYHQPNVAFHVHDCFRPFADGYRGSFDIVNIRFWLCIINDPDFEPLFRNLLTLLKPDGYIQWIEPLPLATKVVSDNPEAPTTVSDKITLSWYKPKQDSSYNWVSNMQESFKAAGLTDVIRSQHSIPEYLRPLWFQGGLAALEDTISLNDDDRTTKVASKQLMDGWQHEFSLGVYVDTPFQCVVGRKG